MAALHKLRRKKNNSHTCTHYYTWDLFCTVNSEIHWLIVFQESNLIAVATDKQLTQLISNYPKIYPQNTSMMQTTRLSYLTSFCGSAESKKWCLQYQAQINKKEASSKTKYLTKCTKPNNSMRLYNISWSLTGCMYMYNICNNIRKLSFQSRWLDLCTFAWPWISECLLQLKTTAYC